MPNLLWSKNVHLHRGKKQTCRRSKDCLAEDVHHWLETRPVNEGILRYKDNMRSPDFRIVSVSIRASARCRRYFCRKVCGCQKGRHRNADKESTRDCYAECTQSCSRSRPYAHFLWITPFATSTDRAGRLGLPDAKSCLTQIDTDFNLHVFRLFVAHRVESFIEVGQ